MYQAILCGGWNWNIIKLYAEKVTEKKPINR